MSNKKILCYIYEGMADFEITLILYILKNKSHCEIVFISEDTKPIFSISGLQYIAQNSIDQIKEIDSFDALIIPGGDINNSQNSINKILIDMINIKKLVCAICFAPQFLGRAGILDNYKFTTSCSKEKIQVLGVDDPFNWNNFVDERVVLDRNVITAKGYAFIDFAEKICDYLDLIKDENDRYEKIGRIKEK